MKEVIFIFLCLIIFLLPLPFGGTEEWAVFGLELIVFSLGLVYFFSQLCSKQINQQPDRSTLPLPVLILLLLFLFISIIQIIPLPQSWLKVISPSTLAWRKTLVELNLAAESKYQTISLSPWSSAYEMVKFIAYGIFAFLLSKVVDSKSRIKTLSLVLIAAGLFQALYGMSEHFGGTHRIFTWVNRYYAGSAFGTFVNRDHYSAFLEMIFPLSLGYFLVRANYFSLRPGLSWRQRLAAFGQENLQKSLLFILPPLIIGVGLVFSRCRSGIIIFLISFSLMMLILSLSRISGRHRTEKKLVRLVFSLVLLAAILIGINPVLERFTNEGLIDNNRLLYYRYTINLIRDFPVAGTGLGTYVKAINPYLEKNFGVIISHAHNDYLEVLAESGLLGGGLLILAGFWLLVFLFKKWASVRHPLGRGLGLGALMGILAIFLHSLTDFSLRMPGNVLLWISLFVLCLKCLSLHPEEDMAEAEYYLMKNKE
ncbi:MAG: O-antigen ligase family protein [Candidatus Aminicenantes bacterium]|nr:O-antigen ligase family protein [Candidatus Aminicenantes bacterium]